MVKKKTVPPYDLKIGGKKYALHEHFSNKRSAKVRAKRVKEKYQKRGAKPQVRVMKRAGRYGVYVRGTVPRKK